MARSTLHLIVAAMIACLFNGCERSPSAETPKELRVLAAASLTDAFKELAADFEQAEPGTRLTFSFAGSNQLRTQLEQGSPGDVFVSADRSQMEAAIKSGVARAETVTPFIANELAILVPKNNPTSISGLSDLGARPMKVVIADGSVPVGRLTQRLIEQAANDPSLGQAFTTRLEAAIVSREQNAASLTTKVALGEADAALGYASEAFNASATKLACISLPEHLRQRTEYVAAVTSHAAAPSHAEAFISFLRTPRAQAVLGSRGLTSLEARRP
jgi:molybdate transport system substrate-binding protein